MAQLEELDGLGRLECLEPVVLRVRLEDRETPEHQAVQGQLEHWVQQGQQEQEG